MQIADMLQTVAEEYHFHVYHTTVLDGGYLLETNCGPKFVSVWQDKNALQWAFQWRESLAAKGFRQVDRFIRTRSQIPSVQVGGEYLVVQDWLQGNSVVLHSKLDWAELGHFIGHLFRVFQDVSTKMETDFHDRLFFWQKKISQTFTPPHLDTWKKELVQRDTFFTSLVSIHWSSLEHRLKQARVLHVTSERNVPFLLTLPELKLSQWQIEDTGYVGFSTRSQMPVFGYEALAHFLQDIYVSEEGSVEKMDAFYQAFERQACPSLAVEHHLLAHLIVPHKFYVVLEKYMDHVYTEEECVDQWLKLCVRQERLDELHLWFAEHLDRKRQESVSG